MVFSNGHNTKGQFKGDNMKKRYTRWQQFIRLIRYRLLVPLLRAKHSPKHTARGVFVGIALGLTPTVGIQIGIVMILWGVFRAVLPRWDFNLVVALAWVWISNVFTMVPLYFGFLITGRFLMGHSESFPNYDTFAIELSSTLKVEADGLSGLWQQTFNLLELYGTPMLIGCLPWALFGGWVGYAWTVKYLLHRANS
tara:strand:- start:46 stop:633 length:588 start_codon:yes stop_codon:yes gene_type:complete